MNKKVLSLVMAGLLSASVVIPAFASSTGTSGGPDLTASGTEVFAGIAVDDPDARIKVAVPTLFAFVVNGSVATSDNGAVSSADGTILLPNVKVEVTAHSEILPDTPATTGKYILSTVVGEGVMQLVNCSTWKPAGTTDRVGMEVTVNGNIKNEGTAASRKNWEYVSAVTGTADPDEFKKYNISIDGESLNFPANDGYELETAIRLDAPNLDPAGDGTYSNLNDTTLLAITGATKTVVFDVAVGGKRNQYKQVEESAKIGTIVWTVSTDEVTGGFYTAPENEYLDGVATGSNTDPDGIPTISTP